MKRATIWALGVGMSLSFLVLLFLQINYMTRFVTLRKAQFDESTYIVNASVTGLNIAYNETEKLNAEVDISAGSFVMDNFAILGNIGSKFNNNGNQKFYIGADARLYTNFGIYLGAGLEYNYLRATDWKGMMYDLHLGYAYFLSRTVAIEPAFYYKHAFNEKDKYDYGFKIGFGCYF